MIIPNLGDKIVQVRAYLTDESFGYEHWRAAQFSAPKHDKYGLLLLFNLESERNEKLEEMKKMSLTRDEWIKVWEAIKHIEYNKLKHLPPRDEDISFIKAKIESVIGQME